MKLSELKKSNENFTKGFFLTGAFAIHLCITLCILVLNTIKEGFNILGCGSQSY